MTEKIYFIQEGNGPIKIGITKDIKKRKITLDTNNSNQLHVLGAITGTADDEAKLHQKFSHLQVKGEWFKPEKELLDFIQNIKEDKKFPLDLGRAILNLENKPPSIEGKECQKLIEIANNLPEVKVTDELIGIDAAAKMLGVSSQTLRNWELQGRLKAHHTKKGHRRYTRNQITSFRKQQIGQKEFVFASVTPNEVLKKIQDFFKNFKPDEKINIIFFQDTVLGKVRITLDSDDGLTTVSRTFNMKDME